MSGVLQRIGKILIPVLSFAGLSGTPLYLTFSRIPFGATPSEMQRNGGFFLPEVHPNDPVEIRIPRTSFGKGLELLRSPCFRVEDRFNFVSQGDVVVPYRIFDHGGEDGMRSVDLLFYKENDGSANLRLFLVRKKPVLGASTGSFLELQRKISLTVGSEAAVSHESPDGGRVSSWILQEKNVILFMGPPSSPGFEIIYVERSSWNRAYRACEIASRHRRNKEMRSIDLQYQKTMNEF